MKKRFLVLLSVLGLGLTGCQQRPISYEEAVAKIECGLDDFESKISVQLENEQDAKEVFDYIQNSFDCIGIREKSYINLKSYSLSLKENNMVVMYDIEYNESKKDYQIANGYTSEFAKFINSKNLTDEDKCWETYRFLRSIAEFDNEVASGNKLASEDYSLTSVLVNGKTVCYGFSNTFKNICDKLDIECEMAVNSKFTPECGHAWNIVTINDNQYMVDVTNMIYMMPIEDIPENYKVF